MKNWIFLLISVLFLFGCSSGEIKLEEVNHKSVEIIDYDANPDLTEWEYDKTATSYTGPPLITLIDSKQIQELYEVKLINKSKSKKISFTIKIEEKSEKVFLKKSHTKIVNLNPGEEFTLGKNYYFNLPTDPLPDTFLFKKVFKTFKTYSIVGERIIN